MQRNLDLSLRLLEVDVTHRHRLWGWTEASQFEPETDLHPGLDSWQVVMAGRVIAVDIMWVREQPGHCGKEDNAAAFQVLVARGD
ncbi:hypothetical protein INR49_012371 [Caranx melampygus]|nr:hypothetical protein INR49_012371 [Caranx melampygus]